MNQAIQFPDREEWNDAQQAVCFPALVNGLQLTCIMRAEFWRNVLEAIRQRCGWRCSGKTAGIWKTRPNS
jgi:hypothetical protein